MFEIRYKTLFKKDYKKLKSQNFDEKLFCEILILLTNKKPLPHKFKNHPLKGKFIGCFDCHIKPDIILIYSFDETTLYLHRIGSHSDLFK